MNEAFERHPRSEDRAEYDIDELTRMLRELALVNGGEYSEQLRVNSDGRVSLATRPDDGIVPFLPAQLAGTPNGKGPRAEEVYRVLREIGDHLSESDISVKEDRTAGMISYRIKSRSAQTGR